ncbi:hypothetical protein JVU11DRAFT_3281 [Chiua virens]|nr:hypothetical protein JVU11DRAFT_3281 [Chiua virens]
MQNNPTSPTPAKRQSRKVVKLKHEIACDKERVVNLEHVRDLFKEAFGISTDDEFLLVGGVSRERVQAFLDGGSGPDPDDLQWDFSRPATSVWNQVVISELVQQLKMKRREEKWSTQPRSDEYWEDAIAQKFARIKARLSSAKPRVRDDSSIETEQEIAKRLLREKDERLQKARKDERRLSKYRRRLRITQTLAEVKAERDDDAAVWAFLLDVVSTLGSDGTSSDESGDEDMEIAFHNHGMPWRRDIKRELNIIDIQRTQDKETFCQKGAKLTKRIRSGNALPSSRRPVMGLPQSFYDPLWLAENPDSASDKMFPWMHIVIQR